MKMPSGPCFLRVDKKDDSGKDWLTVREMPVMKEDSGHFAGELTKRGVQKGPPLKSAICSPSISSLCLEQCLAQRWANTRQCLPLNIRVQANAHHATYLNTSMLYREMAWVHFFLIQNSRSREQRRQVGSRALGQGSVGQEGERVRSQEEGPFHRSTCAHPPQRPQHRAAQSPD